MHEASIVDELLRVAESQARQAGMQKISRMKLRIGMFRMVVPELLKAAFDVMSRDTMADGAELEMEIIPLVARCGPCARELEVEDYVFYCPECGAPLTDIISGKELDLMELEGDGEGEGEGEDK